VGRYWAPSRGAWQVAVTHPPPPAAPQGLRAIVMFVICVIGRAVGERIDFGVDMRYMVDSCSSAGIGAITDEPGASRAFGEPGTHTGPLATDCHR
jgi:hypothetical protein